MKRFLRVTCLTLISASLVACGGGGAGSNDSVESTRAALTTTNLEANGFPWNGAAPGLLKRWELPIPVKTNGDTRANDAMDAIERELGPGIFDRTSIASTPDNEITRGIVVSVGTAFLPAGATNPASYCANVAAAPRAIRPAGRRGVISGSSIGSTAATAAGAASTAAEKAGQSA